MIENSTSNASSELLLLQLIAGLLIGVCLGPILYLIGMWIKELYLFIREK